MVTKQKASEVMSRWIEVINSGDIKLIDQAAERFFTNDYVWHFPGVHDFPSGPACAKQLFRGILEQNPEFKSTLEELIQEGNMVAIRCTMHRKDPTNGKPQHETLLQLSRFVGDKYAEDWELIGQWEDDA